MLQGSVLNVTTKKSHDQSVFNIILSVTDPPCHAVYMHVTKFDIQGLHPIYKMISTIIAKISEFSLVKCVDLLNKFPNISPKFRIFLILAILS